MYELLKFNFKTVPSLVGPDIEAFNQDRVDVLGREI